MDKKSLSHTAWKCQYHIEFIPKYRKKKLYGQVRADVRDIIKTLSNYKGVEIIEHGGGRERQAGKPAKAHGAVRHAGGRGICRRGNG